MIKKDLINGYNIVKGAKYLIEVGSKSYFIFLPRLKYFQMSRTAGNAKLMLWKSKGFSAGSIKPYPTSDNGLSPKAFYLKNAKFWENVNRSCLINGSDDIRPL